MKIYLTDPQLLTVGWHLPAGNTIDPLFLFTMFIPMRRALPETAAMRQPLCWFQRTTSSIDLSNTQPEGQGPKSEEEKQTPGWGRLNES
jgi:hypothetical protein